MIYTKKMMMLLKNERYEKRIVTMEKGRNKNKNNENRKKLMEKSHLLISFFICHLTPEKSSSVAFWRCGGTKEIAFLVREEGAGGGVERRSEGNSRSSSSVVSSESKKSPLFTLGRKSVSLSRSEVSLSLSLALSLSRVDLGISANPSRSVRGMTMGAEVSAGRAG